MHKVYTRKSILLIKKEKFPLIIRRLKYYLPEDDEAQKSESIHFLIRKFGWRCLVDLKTYDIISLSYHADEWTKNAESVLLVCCNYIEPGGVIQIVNENNQTYSAYKFDGKWFKKTYLTRLFVDLYSKEEVIDFFDRAVDAAISSGLNREEMFNVIKEKLVSEYLD